MCSSKDTSQPEVDCLRMRVDPISLQRQHLFPCPGYMGSALVVRPVYTCSCSNTRKLHSASLKNKGFGLSSRTPGLTSEQENVVLYQADVGILSFSGVGFIQGWYNRRKHQHCNCRSDSPRG